MPAFRTDRRKTDRLDDRAPLPGSDFLVGVDRRPPADAHEVVEVVDLIGGLTGELGRASVRTPDERGVDPGVVGGEHVRLVVADENRGLGAEVFEGRARCSTATASSARGWRWRAHGRMRPRTARRARSGRGPRRRLPAGSRRRPRARRRDGGARRHRRRGLPPLPSRVDLRGARRSRREPAQNSTGSSP